MAGDAKGNRAASGARRRNRQSEDHPVRIFLCGRPRPRPPRWRSRSCRARSRAPPILLGVSSLNNRPVAHGAISCLGLPRAIARVSPMSSSQRPDGSSAARTAASHLRQRARLVLLLHECPSLSNVQAAARLDLHPNCVRLWRQRWAQGQFTLAGRPWARPQARLFPPWTGPSSSPSPATWSPAPATP